MRLSTGKALIQHRQTLTSSTGQELLQHKVGAVHHVKQPLVLQQRLGLTLGQQGHAGPIIKICSRRRRRSTSLVIVNVNVLQRGQTINIRKEGLRVCSLAIFCSPRVRIRQPVPYLFRLVDSARSWHGPGGGRFQISKDCVGVASPYDLVVCGSICLVRVVGWDRDAQLLSQARMPSAVHLEH